MKRKPFYINKFIGYNSQNDKTINLVISKEWCNAQYFIFEFAK